MEAEPDCRYSSSLRADLAEGDYRLLLPGLAQGDDIRGWHDVDGEDDPDDLAYDHEPPVPPGLKKLSASMQNFVKLCA